MLYHVDFHIEYPASMSQKDFFSIWAREAEAAVGAKKAGVVIDIWKCVGSRRGRRAVTRCEGTHPEQTNQPKNSCRACHSSSQCAECV